MISSPASVHADESRSVTGIRHIINTYVYYYGPRPVPTLCGGHLPIDDSKGDTTGPTETADCVVCVELWNAGHRP